MDGNEIERIIKILPKVELHVHAEAIVTYDSYHALNLKNKVDKSLKVVGDFRSMFNIQSLKEMIDNFLFMQTLYRNAEDFKYMVRDVGAYCASCNIKYIELHVSPSMILRKGHVGFDDFMNVLIQGFDALHKDGGPDTRIIIDLSRSFGMENARNNLNSLLSYLGRYPTKRIVGVGLGGQEIGNSCLVYKDVLLDARKAGLHVVAHAGEECGSESIWDALLEIKAERIGHGTSAMFDEKLMQYLRDNKITVEVCPTSNVITRKYVQTFAEHPIKKFIDNGIKVSINTDDPVLFDIDLNGEYTKVATTFNLSTEDILALMKNSIDASFQEASGKARLLKELNAAAKKL